MFEIKNIKVSFKINPICLNTVIKSFEKNNISYTEKNNYLIIKNKFVYIFFKSGSRKLHFVNITKISCPQEIKQAIDYLKNYLLKFIILDIKNEKIDNITANFDYKQNINLYKIITHYSHSYNIKFNQEKFPGLFLKTKLGTFIIFHTGKINLIGCKDLNILPKLFQHVKNILKNNDNLQTS